MSYSHAPRTASIATDVPQLSDAAQKAVAKYSLGTRPQAEHRRTEPASQEDKGDE